MVVTGFSLVLDTVGNAASKLKFRLTADAGVPSLLLVNTSPTGDSTAALTCSPGLAVASDEDEDIESLLNTFADVTEPVSDSVEFFRSVSGTKEAPKIGSASNVGDS